MNVISKYYISFSTPILLFYAVHHVYLCLRVWKISRTKKCKVNNVWYERNLELILNSYFLQIMKSSLKLFTKMYLTLFFLIPIKYTYVFFCCLLPYLLYTLCWSIKETWVSWNNKGATNLFIPANQRIS